jgi:ankyrin repeat protein
MIKKYIQFLNEGINDYLKGPTKEELINNLNTLESGKALRKSVEYGFNDLVKKYALKYKKEYSDNVGKEYYNTAPSFIESLCIACQDDNLEIVKFFVEDMEIEFHDFDEVALRSATACDNIEIAKYLLDKGADVTARNNYPLRIAKENGKMEIYNLMLTYIKKNEGINDYLKGPSNSEVLDYFFNKKDEDKLLTNAIKFSSIEYIAKAIEMGASYNDMLSKIIFDYDDVELLEKVLEIYDINEMDSEDVIEIFDRYPNIEFKRVIITKITNKNLLHEILLLSCYQNSEITIFLLLDKDKDKLDIGEALVKASYYSDIKIVKYLLDNGANIHYNNDEALCNAIEEGRTLIVKLLLEYGADLYSDGILDIVRRYEKGGYCTDMISLIKEKDYLNKL